LADTKQYNKAVKDQPTSSPSPAPSKPQGPADLARLQELETRRDNNAITDAERDELSRIEAQVRKEQEGQEGKFSGNPNTVDMTPGENVAK